MATRPVAASAALAKQLERVCMTPLRAGLFVVAMPFAVVALLIGLGWIGMSAVVSGEPSLSTIPARAYGLALLGLVAIATIVVLKRGSGAFGRVLRIRAAEIVTVRFVRLAAGSQLGMGAVGALVTALPVESGHVVLLDAGGRPLAQTMVNHTRDFDVVARAVAHFAPAARIEEATQSGLEPEVVTRTSETGDRAP